MKRIFILLALGGIVACSQKAQDPTADNPEVTDPITIESPSAGKVATKVELTPEQKAYMKAGQAFGFRCMEKLYASEDLIFSPLSLQYALAMAAGGEGRAARRRRCDGVRRGLRLRRRRHRSSARRGSHADSEVLRFGLPEADGLSGRGRRAGWRT